MHWLRKSLERMAELFLVAAAAQKESMIGQGSFLVRQNRERNSESGEGALEWEYAPRAWGVAVCQDSAQPDATFPRFKSRQRRALVLNGSLRQRCLLSPSELCGQTLINV